MLPLQWVGCGLLIVIADLSLDGWDVLADPVGWAMVLLGVSRLAHVLDPGVRWVVLAALAVSVVTWPPGLLELSAPLAWAVSLPEEVLSIWLAFNLARAVPKRERTLRLLGWSAVVVAVSPPVVLVLESAPLVVLLAGFAVITTAWLVVLLFLAADELPPADATGVTRTPENA